MDREPGCPPAQGLYDPRHEKDACGVGFVVNVKGVRSHAIVRQALQLLVNLLHRGACGCEVNTGDGAGILIQMPDKFLRKEARNLGITLPPAGEYGAGCVFLPRDPSARATIEALIETDRPGRRADAARLARSADRRSPGRRVGGGRRAVLQADLHRAAEPLKATWPTVACRLRAQALRHPQAHRARGRQAADLDAPTRSISTSRACRRTR